MCVHDKVNDFLFMVMNKKLLTLLRITSMLPHYVQVYNAIKERPAVL